MQFTKDILRQKLSRNEKKARTNSRLEEAENVKWKQREKRQRIKIKVYTFDKLILIVGEYCLFLVPFFQSIILMGECTNIWRKLYGSKTVHE